MGGREHGCFPKSILNFQVDPLWKEELIIDKEILVAKEEVSQLVVVERLVGAKVDGHLVKPHCLRVIALFRLVVSQLVFNDRVIRVNLVSPNKHSVAGDAFTDSM